MWYHLFTVNTGSVRIPDLKNHYKQNNDFLKTIYPENYLPPHQRLNLYFRVARLLIAVPIMLLMAVSVLNMVNTKEIYDLCLRRNQCMAYCQADVFPELTCGQETGVSITYNGNEYTDLFKYPATNTEEFQTCKDYMEDNEGFDWSNQETDRQWRVHTCFRSCKMPGSEDPNFEEDGRSECQVFQDSTKFEFYEFDLLCVNSDSDCEPNRWWDEICLSDGVCWSWTVVLISIGIANLGQLMLEQALYYTLNTTYKPTEFDRKYVLKREDEGLKEDEEPSCGKVTKKCTGEMVIATCFLASVLTSILCLIAAYKYGRPDTIWLEWGSALLIDQVKSLLVQPLIWWVVLRRCGKLPGDFDVWRDEQVVPAINDDSFLMEIRRMTQSFFQTKPMAYGITGLVLFYAVFILVNLSVDPYIQNSDGALDFFYYTDLVLLCIFVVEILLRFFAWTFEFLLDPWNFLDTVVVLVSFVFSIMRLEVKGIAILRLLRLVRVVIAMRRVSEGKKKLLLLRNQDQSVSSNVTKVLDILEEIQGEKFVSRNEKQDLAWIIDLVQTRKLYMASNDSFEETEVSEEVNFWRKKIKNDYEEFEGEAASKETKGEDKTFRRQRQSAAEIKMSGSEFYKERVIQLFTTHTIDRDALDIEKVNEMQEAFEGVDEWNWDMNKFVAVSGDYCFPFMALKLFLKYDIYKSYNDFNMDKWMNFTLELYLGYTINNPYHRHEHIIDTVHATHYFYEKAGLKYYLTQQDIVIGITAAFIHDYEHPGLNNQFLIRTKHPKAIRYSDLSPLENHHVAAAFKLMMSEDKEIFDFLDDKNYRLARKMLIYMVLRSDLAYHFELYNVIQTKILSEKFPTSNVEDRVTLLTYTLHCADICKPARPWFVYRQWIENMTEEFFLQGDMEKELGIPVSSFMDRDNTNKERVQLTYIEYVVRESIRVLNILSPIESEGQIQRDLIDNGITFNIKTINKKLGEEVKF